jgi:regulator of sigma E protease
MRVDEFGIGFPPKLFGIKKGETEYTFNLLPIGGFVKIYGEDSVGVGEDATQGAFTSKSKWAQSAVLVAGVTMNVLFAWLLVTFAFGIGVQSSVTEAQATENAQLVISHVVEGSPASVAEIPAGAVIKSVQTGDDTLDTLSPSAFSAFIGEHADEVNTIAYTVGGELRMTAVTPERGIIESAPDQAALGVALAQVDILKRGFVDSITDSFMYVVTGLRDITVGIGMLLYGVVTGTADFSQVAGPVGIVGLVGEASAYGITTLLMFTAFISLNLAVINILPFPALDGGRLVMVGIEAVKGSPIRPQWVGAVNMVGFALLILLMVVVTWNDIARLI